MFFYLLTIFVIPCFLCADEIFLKEGKTLQGTITKEDTREYTILLGSNMYLRVDKTKVSNVTRSPKKERATIRADLSPTKSVQKSSGTARSSATLPTPFVSQVKAGVQQQTTKKDVVTIQKSIAIKTYPVEGKTLVDIEAAIVDKKNGRQPSKTEWQAYWEGAAEKDGSQMKWKWVVVRSTITTALPAWKAPVKPDSRAVLDWNKFLTEANAYSSRQIQIYSASLESLAEELSALRADNEQNLRHESQLLFQTMKEQAEKKQKGYERRTAEKKAKPLPHPLLQGEGDKNSF